MSIWTYFGAADIERTLFPFNHWHFDVSIWHCWRRPPTVKNINISVVSSNSIKNIAQNGKIFNTFSVDFVNFHSIFTNWLWHFRKNHKIFVWCKQLRFSSFCHFQSSTGGDVCAYCKQASQDLGRLNNPELVEMMREYNPRFARASKLCAVCKERAKAKLQRRKRNEKLAEQKAARSTNDKSTSYSNRSDNPGNTNATKFQWTTCTPNQLTQWHLKNASTHLFPDFVLLCHSSNNSIDLKFMQTIDGVFMFFFLFIQLHWNEILMMKQCVSFQCWVSRHPINNHHQAQTERTVEM